MGKSQRVAYFVGSHRSDKFAHQFIIEMHLLCAWITWTALDKIPIPQDRHQVVIPVYVALKDLTASRISDDRAGRIGE